MKNEFTAVIEHDGKWLLKLSRKHGCYLKREGRSHSLWANPVTGVVKAVPRHSEIANKLSRKMCRNSSVPDVDR